MSQSHCECSLAGYCTRHKVDKPAHWVHLCQTHTGYWDRWEAGKGPGQVRPSEEREARQRQVVARVTARRRLIGWLVFFRDPDDRGLGDTAKRFERLKPVAALLAQCGCVKTDAVERLNKELLY